mmetsp:Transcript_23681/g.27013  ORF Transcript_23681/g.27013 Transcript_23681/m.27013 type:complete len:405 (-) Transcript_23681:517-1731(-)
MAVQHITESTTCHSTLNNPSHLIKTMEIQIPCPRQEHSVSTPTQSSLKKRVYRLLKRKENKICLDCSKSSPRWITILSVPPPYVSSSNVSHADTFFIGGFCCLECSGAHRRLGTHISFVRSIELDTLKENEVKALECGGNELINNVFEGNMLQTSVGESEVSVSYAELKPDASAGQKPRESFIRNKYEKKLYLDIKAMSQFRQNTLKKNRISSPTGLQLISPASSSSSVSPQALQLQVFTSSPRTLAMIEKYMNPKPKRNYIRRFMKNAVRRPRKFSRKKTFHKSLRNLRGIVGVNPTVNIVETRSVEFPGDDSCSDSECDGVHSVTSTRSTMSAALRRGFMSTVKKFSEFHEGSKEQTNPFLTNTPMSNKRKKKKKKKNLENCKDRGVLIEKGHFLLMLYVRV